MTYEYSNAERLMFKHFGAEHLCEHIAPYPLYTNTCAHAFLEYDKFDFNYKNALKAAFRAIRDLGRSVCRLTPEFDKLIMNAINDL